MSRGALIRLTILFAILATLALGAWAMMIRMPGETHAGPLLPLSAEEERLRDALRRDVEKLAGEIGERNLRRYERLVAAADSIEESLAAAGYEVHRQRYDVAGKSCDNLEVEIAGASRPNEIVVIGAHYDSVTGSPGANDNATGVAAMLALARAFADRQPARTLRFVGFVNEEPPYFQTDDMGSRVYARGCRQRGENIVAMLSIETIGYFSDQPGSQSYPPPFGMLYPSTGNFIAFVGNVGSRDLVRELVGSFRRHAKFPSEGGAIPSIFPGVGWSDHWSFWREGYSAVMVTDTAPFRYPYYHGFEDTPDKIDYERTARIVSGLQSVVTDLVK